MDNYFFNKVSDFLFGLLFLTFFIFLVFYSKKIRKVKKSKFLIIYFILIFLTFQWFYFLPTLRYGGYHLIALLFFIPFSLILEKFLVKPDLFKKKVYFLIVLTMIIFLGRNTFRLIDEYEIYNYNVFNNTYFRKDEKRKWV